MKDSRDTMARCLLLTGIFFGAAGHGIVASASEASLSPVSGLFRIPDTLAGADLLDDGSSYWSVSGAVANHASRNRSPREFLLLDGETVRVNFAYTRGLGENWQFGLDIPWINHSSGGLDRLIDTWHDMFLLPNGIRDSARMNDLDFSYDIDGTAVISRQNSASGIGDISFQLSRRLLRSNKRSVALGLMVKVPSGESSRLTGSGATDVGVTINSSFHSLAGNENFSATAGAAIVFAGSNDIDRLRNESVIFAAGASVKWQLTPGFSLNAGVNGHSAVIKSDLRAFKPALQLSASGAFALSDRFELRAGFSEDIRVDTYPDVAFRIEFVRRSGQ